MPLIFGAICPHPPVLIPTVGRQNIRKLTKTKKAFEKLEAELYAAKPDTIIIISPHGNLLSEAFAINHSPELSASFDDFGDFETKLEFKNDMALAYQIRESIETKHSAILSTDEKLDYGAAVPLFYLTRHLPQVKIIPISYSLLPYLEHIAFGKSIKQILNSTNKRVAVIASADLSHRLTADAPAGYSPLGQEFDKQLIELIKSKNVDSIIKLDKKLVKEAGECGLRSILILLGIFDGINYQPEVLSYQGPFGVGYFVCNFQLK